MLDCRVEGIGEMRAIKKSHEVCQLALSFLVVSRSLLNSCSQSLHQKEVLEDGSYSEQMSCQFRP
jgi:hypothetical protein